MTAKLCSILIVVTIMILGCPNSQDLNRDLALFGLDALLDENQVETQGADGQDGTQGIQGETGADGKDGVGTDGVDGTDGEDGTDGTDGVDGVDGKDGVDGVDGKDGADGKDGTDGVDGTDGTDGDDGDDGKDGLNLPCEALGTVSEDGVELNGSGYTVARLDRGLYRIVLTNFNPLDYDPADLVVFVSPDVLCAQSISSSRIRGLLVVTVQFTRGFGVAGCDSSFTFKVYDGS